ncbi:hypothetical protein SAY86_028618 [Trapa natans]|uniref:Potassium transporter n=1 Tax=Trapa natans TaxID=22666 RepID=A0AAN7RAX4_TRANT|nr:hypothetical protein SAY86_028618 [Trapa natans]
MASDSRCKNVLLAYQSLGIIFAHLSISPLYVYRVTFSGRLRHHQSEEVIFGAFSLIFWTLALFSLLKYAVFMLTVDDNGEGGIFAIYSLLCRHAKLSLLPNHQAADEELSSYQYPRNCSTRSAPRCKRSTELLNKRKNFLLLLVLFSTSMVVCVAVLTPAITGNNLHDRIAMHFNSLLASVLAFFWLTIGMAFDVSCVLLVCLFVIQHKGIDKATSMLSPIMTLWLLSIAAIGLHNILVWNPRVMQALSPNYIYRFFNSTGKDGLVPLGGIILCVTGAPDEMFHDLTSEYLFPSTQIAFLCVAYPSLVLQYMGQAAFLSKNFHALPTSFHASIPHPVFWPVYLMAIFVAVISSQSAISGSFSIIRQTRALGCFPRIKVLRASRWINSQIYIPELNWFLMVLCLAMTAGFRNMDRIANAYGDSLNISSDIISSSTFSGDLQILTTFHLLPFGFPVIAWITQTIVVTLITPLMIKLVWNKNTMLAIAFFLLYGPIETIFLVSSCHGIPRGGWASLLISGIFTAIMFIWHYATKKKFLYDQHNKVPMKWIIALGPSLGVIRVPGIGIFFTELATGIPFGFTHFLDNLPVFYQVAVFVCVKTVPVPYVLPKDRYLISRIGPKSYRLYRCIIRNGYKDVNHKEDDFESDLILCLAEFVQLEAEGSGTLDRSTDGRMAVVCPTENLGMRVENLDVSAALGGGTKSTVLQKLQARYFKESSQLIHRRSVQFKLHQTMFRDPGVKEELLELVEAKRSGMTYIIGHPNVKAKPQSPFLKKFAIDVVYSFLQKNSRSTSVTLSIPQVCLIDVGLNYYV